VKDCIQPITDFWRVHWKKSVNVKMVEDQKALYSFAPTSLESQMGLSPFTVCSLTWVGDMYATRFDLMIDLAREMPGPGANPDGISVSAVRQMVDRWRRANWVGYQQFLAAEPPYLWLTRTGLAAFDMTDYKAAAPAISRLRHIHAVDCVRYDIEGKGDEWISERAIRAGRYDVSQEENQMRHIPDGILQTQDGDIAIEVELTQKKPDELYHKLNALIHATRLSTYGYAYEGMRFYTPSTHIKKALEVARAAHLETRMGDQARVVEIMLVDLE
jgi:hypothetical protein